MEHLATVGFQSDLDAGLLQQAIESQFFAPLSTSMVGHSPTDGIKLCLVWDAGGEQLMIAKESPACIARP